MTKGLFVTFEGGEGAGKSTLATRLRDALQREAQEVVFTREPGGTAFGEELRNLILHHKGHVGSHAELFLFLAARIQHVEELIKPALNRGAIVLSDRFTDSSIAYQGEARGLGMQYVADCTKLAIGNFEPDLTFYVDIDPTIGLGRTHTRRGDESVDRLESQNLEFHQKVRAGFLQLAKLHPHRIITLDGTLEPDVLFKIAHEVIQRRTRDQKDERTKRT